MCQTEGSSSQYQVFQMRLPFPNIFYPGTFSKCEINDMSVLKHFNTQVLKSFCPHWMESGLCADLTARSQSEPEVGKVQRF